MKIKNYTPHPIIVFGKDKQKVLEPCGIIPRLKEEREYLYSFNIEGIEVSIFLKCYAELVWEGGKEPKPDKGEMWIVSALVAEAVQKKYPMVTVLVPDELVRDEKGNVVGCRSFWTPPKEAKK